MQRRIELGQGAGVLSLRIEFRGFAAEEQPIVQAKRRAYVSRGERSVDLSIRRRTLVHPRNRRLA
jgi:hypothetical protein